MTISPKAEQHLPPQFDGGDAAEHRRYPDVHCRYERRDGNRFGRRAGGRADEDARG